MNPREAAQHPKTRAKPRNPHSRIGDCRVVNPMIDKTLTAMPVIAQWIAQMVLAIVPKRSGSSESGFTTFQYTPSGYLLLQKSGAPERTRTSGPQLRKLMLYPLSYERVNLKLYRIGGLVPDLGGLR